MLAFRNFSVCAALLAMVAFSITGCCSGNCRLLGGGASAPVSQGISSGGCSTCGGAESYSAPAQSYSSPSYSTQDFSTQQFSNSVPTSAGSGSVNLPSGGSGSVNLPSVQADGQSFGGGSISVPSVGGSGAR